MRCFGGVRPAPACVYLDTRWNLLGGLPELPGATIYEVPGLSTRKSPRVLCLLGASCGLVEGYLMPRSRVVEVDYHPFQTELQIATGAGHRIEPTDKERWATYIRDHEVKEAACASVVRARGGSKVRAVIIDDEGPWAGYYVFAPDEELCLRFERQQD